MKRIKLQVSYIHNLSYMFRLMVAIYTERTIRRSFVQAQNQHSKLDRLLLVEHNYLLLRYSYMFRPLTNIIGPSRQYIYILK